MTKPANWNRVVRLSRRYIRLTTNQHNWRDILFRRQPYEVYCNILDEMALWNRAEIEYFKMKIAREMQW